MIRGSMLFLRSFFAEGAGVEENGRVLRVVDGRMVLGREERKDWRRGEINWRIEECGAIVRVVSW